MVQDVGAGQEACGFRQTATVSAGATCQGVVRLAIPILPRSGKPRTKRPIDKEEFGRRGKKCDAPCSPALIHVQTGAYGLAGCLLLRRQAAQAAKKAASEAFKTDPLLTDPDVPVNRPMKKKSEMGERAPEGLQVRRSLSAPQSQGGRGRSWLQVVVNNTKLSDKAKGMRAIEKKLRQVGQKTRNRTSNAMGSSCSILAGDGTAPQVDACVRSRPGGRADCEEEAGRKARRVPTRKDLTERRAGGRAGAAAAVILCRGAHRMLSCTSKQFTMSSLTKGHRPASMHSVRHLAAVMGNAATQTLPIRYECSRATTGPTERRW